MATQSKTVFDADARYEVEQIEIVIWEDDKVSLPATVFKPKADGPFPALIRVHGGAWNVGKREDKARIDHGLAECGMVVVAMEHRRAPDYPYPAQVLDTNYAVRWLKLHAAEYDVDPAHVGGAGDSSGGHTMLLNAMFPNDPTYGSIALEGDTGLDGSVEYVIAMWTVLDPYTRYWYAVDHEREDIVRHTDNYFSDTNEMKLANPQMILERGTQQALPPVIIIQGDTDDNIPNYVPLMFVDTYKAAGGDVRIEWFPGMPHSFAAKEGAEPDRAIEIMRRYVAAQLNT